MIVGVGIDVVETITFAAQIGEPGTRFMGAFTSRERRNVQARAAAHAVPGEQADLSTHLAARWAAKEAFIKAWSSAMVGQPPVISPENVVWTEIEIIQDQWGRPSIQLHGDVARLVEHTLGGIRVHVSMSHDGGVASAVVTIEGSIP